MSVERGSPAAKNESATCTCRSLDAVENSRSSRNDSVRDLVFQTPTTLRLRSLNTLASLRVMSG